MVASMMGLDQVKLGQCYLVLHSVYTTHMGQGKEAAQVAMKYATSDLQQEAAAQEGYVSYITSGSNYHCQCSRL